MKKSQFNLVALALLIICFISPLSESLSAQIINMANAEKKAPSELSNGGIKLGIGISNMTDGEESIGPILAFEPGLYYHAVFSETFGIQMELLYATRGSGDSEPGVGSIEFNLSYISIPLLLAFRLGENAHLFVGPRLSLYLGGTVSGNIISGDADGVTDYDFGLDLGAAFSVSENVKLEFRISRGFVSLVAPEYDAIYNIAMLGGVSLSL